MFHDRSRRGSAGQADGGLPPTLPRHWATCRRPRGSGSSARSTCASAGWRCPRWSPRAPSRCSPTCCSTGTRRSPRQRLAFLLWPDSTEAQARTNLRHVLHTLRRALPERRPATSRSRRARCAGGPEAPFWLDVAAFEAAARAAEPDDRPTAASPRCGRPSSSTAATCSRAATTSGSSASGSGCASATSRRSRELAGLLRGARRPGRGDRATPSGCCASDPLREADLPAADAAARRARRPRAGAARLPRLRRDAGARAGRRAVRGDRARPTRRCCPAAPAAGRSAAGPTARRPAARRAGRRSGPGWPPPGARPSAGARSSSWSRGEPGVGKTRLVEEFRAWCARRGVADRRGALLRRRRARWPTARSWRGCARRRSRPRLRRLDRARLTELARLLPELLDERARPGRARAAARGRAAAPAVRRRRRGRRCAAGGPLLLVADDLQLGDRETCQLAALPAAGRSRTPALLVVATARREELDDDHPLHDLLAGLRGHGPADRDRARAGSRRRETAALAERLTGAAARRAGRATACTRETEGNPLFVVEALRAGWRRQRGRAAQPAGAGGDRGPARRSSSPPARDLVGVAATIGREFTTDVLRAPASRAATRTRWCAAWTSCGGAGIVREQGARRLRLQPRQDPRGRLPRRSARPGGAALHLRVAARWSGCTPPSRGRSAAQIAAHYDRAGAADAGRRVVPARGGGGASCCTPTPRRSGCWSARWTLLAALPAIRRPRRARSWRSSPRCSPPLVAVEGYASAAVTAAQRARARAGRGAAASSRAPPLLRSLALSAPDPAATSPRRTRVRRRSCARAASATATTCWSSRADYVLGVAAFWQADFAAARRHFERRSRATAPSTAARTCSATARTRRWSAWPGSANTLWFLGRAGRGAQRAQRAALAWAEEIGHPYSRAVAAGVRRPAGAGHGR